VPYLAGFITPQDYGAAGNGVADDTAAFAAALAAVSYGVLFVPPGTYPISAPLLVPAGASVIGAGAGATYIKIAAGFSGAAVFSAAAVSDVLISGMTIFAISASYASNPPCDAISVSASQRCVIRDIYIQYVNGWGVEVAASGTASALWAVLDNIHTYRCNQGIHLLGAAGEGYNAGAFMLNCNVEQTAGWDGLLIEDAHDVTCANLEGWNTSTSTGITLHVKGNSHAVYVTGFSLGGLTGSAPQPQAVTLIESGANGAPAQVVLAGGIIEAGTPGLSVTAGTEIMCRDVNFFSNADYGAQVSGSASPDVTFSGCTFNSNGYSAGSSNFDASLLPSNGIVQVLGCEFLTPSGTGSQRVASAVNANGQVWVKDCRFAGAGAFGGGGGGYPKLTRGNIGYNPVGPLVPPGIPSSGSPLTSPFGVDCDVYVTGGSVSAIAVGGTATGLTAGSFRVPVGQSVTLTYGSAPSWTWFGD
jgi:pectate lyase-like protein